MSDEELPEIARKIRDAIEKTGETQAEIARRAGINRDMMNRYVRGITRPPLPKITAIAQALEMDPREFDERAEQRSAIDHLPFSVGYDVAPDGKCRVVLNVEVRSIEDAADLSNKLRQLIVRYRR